MHFRISGGTDVRRIGDSIGSRSDLDVIGACALKKRNAYESIRCTGGACGSVAITNPDVKRVCR